MNRTTPPTSQDEFDEILDELPPTRKKVLRLCLQGHQDLKIAELLGFTDTKKDRIGEMSENIFFWLVRILDYPKMNLILGRNWSIYSITTRENGLSLMLSSSPVLIFI
jgi:hypothetical protein